MRKIVFSLPGIMRELSTTVSPGLMRNVLVVIHRHTRKRRHRLALRARNQHRGFRRLRIRDILRPDQYAVRNIEQSVPVRDFRYRNHAAAHQRHFAAELVRKIENQLQAVNRRTEAGNEQPVLRPVENVFQARTHGAFGIRIARPVRIGRIGKQQQNAALAVIGQRVQIEQLVVGRAWGRL